jgi:hypothetical protein
MTPDRIASPGIWRSTCCFDVALVARFQEEWRGGAAWTQMAASIDSSFPSLLVGAGDLSGARFPVAEPTIVHCQEGYSPSFPNSAGEGALRDYAAGFLTFDSLQRQSLIGLGFPGYRRRILVPMAKVAERLLKPRRLRR